MKLVQLSVSVTFRLRRCVLSCRTLLVVLGVFACILLTACSSMSDRCVEGVYDGGQRLARNRNLRSEVDSLAKPLIEQGVTPGMVVGVLIPQPNNTFSMHFYGYGVADQETGIRPDSNTIFPIGSLSKGFLGALTAMLVEEGVLSWHDKLENLLPPTIKLSEDAKLITVLQLATHTSGLPREPRDLETLSRFLKFLFTGKNFYTHLDHGGALTYLSDFKSATTTEFRYSNIGYAILGKAVEYRTRLSLDALLKKYLAQPLSLQNTAYATEFLPNNVKQARGYAGDQPKFIRRGSPVMDWKWTASMKGSAGIYSSAQDLLIFAAAHLKTGNKNTPSVLRDNLNVRFNRPQNSAGIAWLVHDIQGERVAFQMGYQGGFSSYIGINAQRKIAVVVLQNSFNWTDSVGHKLLLQMAHAEKSCKEVSFFTAIRKTERMYEEDKLLNTSSFSLSQNQ